MNKTLDVLKLIRHCCQLRILLGAAGKDSLAETNQHKPKQLVEMYKS